MKWFLCWLWGCFFLCECVVEVEWLFWCRDMVCVWFFWEIFDGECFERGIHLRGVLKPEFRVAIDGFEQKALVTMAVEDIW